MGYRSKVIIGVKNGKLSNEFDKVLQRHDFNTNDNSADYLKIHTENDGMKFYTFEHTKWYSTDDWCKDIMDFLNNNSYNDFRMTNEDVFCVGLGEEGELHSEVGDYWDFVDVIRDINLID
jgi:hypothetical protein